MGGADKGLLSLHGRPLVEHVIDRLKPQVEQLKIIANRNQATYADQGLPLLTDLLPDYPGPLVGILSGLTDCETDYALFIPADAPNLPHNLVERLWAAQKAPAVAADSRGWQPLCCILAKSALPALQAAVERGERSPMQWLRSQAPTVSEFTEGEWVWSVNTPQELSNLQAQPELAA